MKLNSNKIEFETGKVLTFNFPVLKTLIHGDVIIVLLNIPRKTIFNENVYGVNQSGDLLWQIGKHESSKDNCPFIDMYINDENKLTLRNWCHLNYEIDSKSGSVLRKEGYGW